MTKICLVRTGALGDVLEVTPIAMRLVGEGHQVFIKTNYHQVFMGLDPNISIGGPNFRDFNEVYDLNGAFENDKRQLHPIDSFSKIVFGDTKTEHRIYFHYPKMKKLAVNGSEVAVPIAVIHAARSWAIRTLPRS